MQVIWLLRHVLQRPLSRSSGSLYGIDGVTGDVNAPVVCARIWQFLLFFTLCVPIMVLFRARAFENPATFHKVAKSHWTVQWFIQANQKTSPSPLLINIAVTLSIYYT